MKKTHLDSINDVFRVPFTYVPNHTKRVKYFNEEALPKCKEDLHNVEIKRNSLEDKDNMWHRVW